MCLFGLVGVIEFFFVNLYGGGEDGFVEFFFCCRGGEVVFVNFIWVRGVECVVG